LPGTRKPVPGKGLRDFTADTPGFYAQIIVRERSIA